MRLPYFTKEQLIRSNDAAIAEDPDALSLRQDAIAYLPKDIRCPVTWHSVSKDGTKVLCRIILGVKEDGEPSAVLLIVPIATFVTLPTLEAGDPN